MHFLAFLVIFPIFLFADIIAVKDSKGLHLALKEATSNGTDDTILIEDGNYFTNDSLIGTFTYEGIDGKNLTIKSKSNNPNLVSISGGNIHRIFLFTSQTPIEINIENITIENGRSDQNGSAIYTLQNLNIKNVNFTNNQSQKSGGAIFAKDIKIDSSSFKTNTSGYNQSGTNSDNLGGGAIFGESIEAIDTIFSENISYYGSGGGIYGDDITLLRAYFGKNKTGSVGKASSVLSNSSLIALNSLFTENSSVDKATIYGSDLVIINSTFWNNSSINSPNGIYGKGFVANSIFEGSGMEIKITGTSTLYNNYLDFSSLADIENNSSQTVYMSDNIQILSGDDFFDADLKIDSSGASIIDSGINISSSTFEDRLNEYISDTTKLNFIKTNMEMDLANNIRTYKAGIDIGAYEFESELYQEKPIITDFDYEGVLKTGEEIVFSFEATASKNRELSKLYIDFGQGFEETEANSSKASYSKTFDYAGEYKVVAKALDNQGDFATSTLDIKILETCFNLCDLTPYDLNQSDIEPLEKGWHLMGAPRETNIKNKLPGADLIWKYENNEWYSYESNSTQNSFENIKAKQGFWLYKY